MFKRREKGETEGMAFPMAVFDEQASLADQQTAELCLTLSQAGVTLREAQAYGSLFHARTD